MEQNQIIYSHKIKESVDTRYGREFSYTFWIYIKNSNYGYTTETDCKKSKSNFKHIFHKGSEELSKSCKNIIDDSKKKNTFNNLPLLQFPGVWLDSNNNDLLFNVNTQKDSITIKAVQNSNK